MYGSYFFVLLLHFTLCLGNHAAKSTSREEISDSTTKKNQAINWNGKKEVSNHGSYHNRPELSTGNRDASPEARYLPFDFKNAEYLEKKDTLSETHLPPFITKYPFLGKRETSSASQPRSIHLKATGYSTAKRDTLSHREYV